MTASATVPTVETVAPGLPTRLSEGSFVGHQKLWFAAGVMGVAASLYGWSLGEESARQFLHSYLVAYAFVLSLCLGGMFFVLVQHLSRAGWSVVVRRIAENAMGVVPYMLPLFLPIAIGYATLYGHWVHALDHPPGDPLHDPVLWGKRGFLNPPFFFIRAALYFVIWIGISRYFRGTSIRQDQSGDASLSLKMSRVAAPCMLLFALSITFAAVDWLMSLDPHWFSTIWGVYYFAGSFMTFLAFLGLVCMWLRRHGWLSQAINTEHYHDIGKLMFAFVVFWTYIAFSQFMLIYYANLPEETSFYQHRQEGSWLAIGKILVWGHFMIPFAFLISRHMKRAKVTLAIGSVYLLAMHVIDMHWIIMPNLHHHGAHPTWLDAVSLIGLVGLFLAIFIRNLRSAPLIPERDPRLRESLRFINH
ncbi:MAG: hypothetical protein QF412_04380 [Planctomycetota bacterium]|jgi:hypothetical protein|nr:hypothetical protein [Planctomycetota bacterium]